VNLIKQFPDVSMHVRRQVQFLNQKQIQKEKLPKQLIENGLTQFYDKEFRKWHYKLLFIIVFAIACLYGAVILFSVLFSPDVLKYFNY
jgi:hypothetical protein